MLILLAWIFTLFPKFALKYLWVLSNIFPQFIAIGIRYSIAKRLMKGLGKNVYFANNIEIRDWSNIFIANNVSIHNNCYIDGSGDLEIGNDVSIAHNCSILTFEHSWSERKVPIKDNPLIFNRITIKDDVWIGCGVRLLSGVTIHSRSIVAAGAVVINDVASNSIVAGVPASEVKNI